MVKVKKSKSNTELAEVLEIVNFIKDYMIEHLMTREEGATKGDMLSGFLRIEERLYSIEQELKDIKRSLTVLEDEIGNVNEKYKKEIEELWKHVAAIEKQLKM